MSSTVQTGIDVHPFQVEIPDEALDDLRRRIAATRWPSKELVGDRSQGVQLETLQELARFWTTDYDWRKAEAKLNALPQFQTEIVGPLTDPTAHGGSAEDAFDLVLPSVPGYGFSAEPTELGWYAGRVAEAWGKLMPRLGYTRYVAQGGDVGAAVTDAMGRQGPEGLIGIHTNLFVPALITPGAFPAAADEERGGRRDHHVQDDRERLSDRAEHAAADDRLR